MLKNFNLPERLKLPSNFTRDPRIVARAVLGVLLAANLIAAFAVFRPLGGSAEELDSQSGRDESSSAAAPGLAAKAPVTGQED